MPLARQVDVGPKPGLGSGGHAAIRQPRRAEILQLLIPGIVGADDPASATDVKIHVPHFVWHQDAQADRAGGAIDRQRPGTGRFGRGGKSEFAKDIGLAQRGQPPGGVIGASAFVTAAFMARVEAVIASYWPGMATIDRAMEERDCPWRFASVSSLTPLCG